jgi:hypothetical protein
MTNLRKTKMELDQSQKEIFIVKNIRIWKTRMRKCLEELLNRQPSHQNHFLIKKLIIKIYPNIQKKMSIPQVSILLNLIALQRKNSYTSVYNRPQEKDDHKHKDKPTTGKFDTGRISQKSLAISSGLSKKLKLG